jgi:hypothetical protein
MEYFVAPAPPRFSRSTHLLLVTLYRSTFDPWANRQ